MGDGNPDLSGTRMWAFVIGSDNRLWNLAYWPGSGSWVWGSLGQPSSIVTVTGGVGALYMGDNNAGNLAVGSRAWVFVRGSDNNLWNLAFFPGPPSNGGWVWGNLGPPSSTVTVSGGVGALYMGDNNAGNLAGSRAWAFVLGSDNNLWNLAFFPGPPSNGSWVWGNLGQPTPLVTASGGLGALYMGDNDAYNLCDSRVWVFVRGTDNNLWNLAFFPGAPSNCGWIWSNLGQPSSGVSFRSGVGTLYMGDNNANNLCGSHAWFFEVGSDWNLWSLEFFPAAPSNCGWTWRNLGSLNTTCCVSSGDGALYIGDNNAGSLANSDEYTFVTSGDGRLWSDWAIQGASWLWNDFGAIPCLLHPC